MNFTLLRSLFAVLALPLLAMTCEEGTVLVGQLSLSPAALNDYRGTYAQDKPHKAFAVSPSGAFAAAHSYPTEALATATALIDCNRRVRVGQGECYLYDVNGTIVAAAPFNVRVK